jgi:hypothetical protein
LLLFLLLFLMMMTTHGRQVPLYKHYGDLSGNSKFVLPVPSFNVINGGKHAGNKLAFQVSRLMTLSVGWALRRLSVWTSVPQPLMSHRFFSTFTQSPNTNTTGVHDPPRGRLLLLPGHGHGLRGACIRLNFDQVRWPPRCLDHPEPKPPTQPPTPPPPPPTHAFQVYHHLAKVIKAKYGQDAVNVGDEGGFAPNIQSNKEGVELLMSAIEKAGYLDQVKVGMDVASSEFLTKDGKYDLDFKVRPPPGLVLPGLALLCLP